VTGRDWSVVKNLGKYQDQNLRMAGDAEEEVPPLQHYSHQHHLRKSKVMEATIILTQRFVFPH
jgi:hypothetical protein